MIDLLVDFPVGKINFAGGEPTLVRGLGALCRRIKERSGGKCAVSVVSNGKHLRKLIEDWGRWIDWGVLSLDSGDDMSTVMRRLAPKRWKLFQVLPVSGENDRKIDKLVITKEEFQAFVERHRPLRDEGVEIIAEDNTHMTNSYYMIGPDGRFFWHTPQGASRALEYGAPILEVGLDAALEQARFSEEKFRARGGVYDWLRDRPVAG